MIKIMEEVLDHMRTETCFVLACTTIGSYVRGYAEGIVTFNSFYPKEFASLEKAIEARNECRKIFNENRTQGYRLSIRKREYQWKPGGNTQLIETTIKLN